MKHKLSKLSPDDKPWDTHKAQSVAVAKIYSTKWEHQRKSERILGCSGVLEFAEVANPDTGEVKLKLFRAKFCRVRYCPICQWRRSLFWKARFYNALPSIMEQYPTARFVFMTLTVKNCDVHNLRETIQNMNSAWNRMKLRKEFKSILGWVRTTEVTRGENNSAHPHFHILMMVPSSYFKGGNYIKKDKWAETWQKSLRVDYTPVVDIRTVKPKTPKKEESAPSLPKEGIIETLKYSVKPTDMVENPQWFLTMSEQTHRLRFIATGGVFRTILKPEEEVSEEDMIHLGDESPALDMVRSIMRFLWSDKQTAFFLEWVQTPPPENR